MKTMSNSTFDSDRLFIYVDIILDELKMYAHQLPNVSKKTRMNLQKAIVSLNKVIAGIDAEESESGLLCGRDIYAEN